MKKQLIFLILLCALTYTKKAAGQTAAESDCVILQIVTPIRTSGETELIFYYGNGKSEVFKKVNYAIKYVTELPNEIVNAINYMSSKGYTLKTTAGNTGSQATAQYIFEKRSLTK
jgi:hypothetical protein